MGFAAVKADSGSQLAVGLEAIKHRAGPTAEFLIHLEIAFDTETTAAGDIYVDQVMLQ